MHIAQMSNCLIPIPNQLVWEQDREPHYDMTSRLNYFGRGRLNDWRTAQTEREWRGKRWRMTLSPRSRPRKGRRLNSLCAISTLSKCKVGRCIKPTQARPRIPWQIRWLAEEREKGASQLSSLCATTLATSSHRHSIIVDHISSGLLGDL